MGALANTVDALARPVTVTIRSLLVYGDDGRPDGSQTETTHTVNIALQPETDRPTELLRRADGDDTTGQWRAWVTDAALAAAVPGPLTELPIAPPEDADGPPGALLDFRGRRYEVIELQAWQDEGFGEPAGFRRYIVAERGATP